MKKLFLPLVSAVVLLTSATITFQTTSLSISSGYSIDFSSKDPSGSFDEMTGTIHFDPEDLKGSKFELEFPISSINTGNNMKNKKAQTSEWFNATKYPEIKYKSTGVVKVDDGYVVTGNLTIKGVTKAQNVPLNVETTSTGYTFSGKFWVNRIKYGVGKESKTVPNVMTINYSIPVKK